MIGNAVSAFRIVMTGVDHCLTACPEPLVKELSPYAADITTRWPREVFTFVQVAAAAGCACSRYNAVAIHVIATPVRPVIFIVRSPSVFLPFPLVNSRRAPDATAR